uniref:methionine--tRNA ligase n=1 Tax=Glossina austeni TaxID=7395 RepID=A0A1A9UKJ9_GLOAU
MNINKKILITCALPYANGELHIGHILEHVQADICVRYHRMKGHDVYFISADDSHGTPVMYYYASKISSSVTDIDFNFTEFMNKINSNIINKIVNLASRSSSFINKYFNDYLSENIENSQLYSRFIDSEFVITNQYLNEKSPWNLVKNIKNNNLHLHEVSSMGINMFYIIMIYLKPILPNLANKSETFLNKNLHWENISKPLKLHRINKFEPLALRIDKKQIDLILKESNKIEI